MRVGVLGGGGLLGRNLTAKLVERGHEVSSFSRSSSPPVDISSGEGLAAAVSASDVVIHLASNARSPQETDVAGTKRVVEAITNQHLVYTSIVGVDRHPLPYYRAKFEAEQIIARSDVEHTIVRATQFHDFLAFLLSKVCRRRLAFVPSGFVFQPIDTAEVADELIAVVERRPPGLQPDLAGPEVLGVRDLARTYMSARHMEAPVLSFPVPGKVGRAFREGLHTNSDRAFGRLTWEEFLDQLNDK